MFGLGVPELLLVLAIIILLFGVGRISKVGLELGQAVSNMRQAIGTSSKDSEEL